MIDGLTGLSNRSFFDRQIEDEIALARRAGGLLSCILSDVDHFKSINDRFGHPFGDEVLRRVATELSQAVREEDVVCRYGGEEFAVISRNTGTHGAVNLAERLREAVAGCVISCRGEAIHVTASFGIAGSDEIALDEMIDHADAALYSAKRAGRNRVQSAQPVAA